MTSHHQHPPKGRSTALALSLGRAFPSPSRSLANLRLLPPQSMCPPLPHNKHHHQQQQQLPNGVISYQCQLSSQITIQTAERGSIFIVDVTPTNRWKNVANGRLRPHLRAMIGWKHAGFIQESIPTSFRMVLLFLFSLTHHSENPHGQRVHLLCSDLQLVNCINADSLRFLLLQCGKSTLSTVVPCLCEDQISSGDVGRYVTPRLSRTDMFWKNINDLPLSNCHGKFANAKRADERKPCSSCTVENRSGAWRNGEQWQLHNPGLWYPSWIIRKYPQLSNGDLWFEGDREVAKELEAHHWVGGGIAVRTTSIDRQLQYVLKWLYYSLQYERICYWHVPKVDSLNGSQKSLPLAYYDGRWGSDFMGTRYETFPRSLFFVTFDYWSSV